MQLTLNSFEMFELFFLIEWNMNELCLNDKMWIYDQMETNKLFVIELVILQIELFFFSFWTILKDFLW